MFINFSSVISVLGKDKVVRPAIVVSFVPLMFYDEELLIFRKTLCIGKVYLKGIHDFLN